MERLYKVYYLVQIREKINKIVSSNPLIQNLMILTEFVSVLLFLFSNPFSHSAPTIVQASIQTINNFLSSGTIFIVALVVTLIFEIILIIALGIYIFKHNLQENLLKKLLDFLSNSSIVFNASIFPLIFILTKTVFAQNNNNYYVMVLVGVALVVMAMVKFLIKSKLLFDEIEIIALGLLSYSSQIKWVSTIFLLIICTSSILAIKSSNLFKKLLHGAVFCVYLWYSIFGFRFKTIETIYLGIFILAIQTLLYFNIHSSLFKYLVNQDFDFYQNVLTFLEEIQQSRKEIKVNAKIQKKIKMKQVQLYINLTNENNRPQVSSQKQMSFQKINEVAIAELLIFKIKKHTQRSQNLTLQMQLLRAMTYSKVPLIQILKLNCKLNEKIISSSTFFEKCTYCSILINLQQYFEAKNKKNKNHNFSLSSLKRDTNLKESYYQIIEKLLKDIDFFWKIVNKNEITIEQFQLSITSIIDSQEEYEKCKIKLLKKGYTLKKEKKIQLLIQNLINQNTQLALLDDGQLFEKFETLQNFKKQKENYILINNGKIKSISPKLLNLIGVEEWEMIDEKSSILFPGVLYSFVENKINDALNFSEEDECQFYLPLMKQSHKVFIPLRCQIVIMPNFINGFSYVFLFENQISNKGQYILYKVISDQILLLSQGFNQYFNFNSNQLKNQNIFGCEIFGDRFNQKENFMKCAKGEELLCEINLNRMIKRKRFLSTYEKHVFLQISEIYEEKAQKIILLKIMHKSNQYNQQNNELGDYQTLNTKNNATLKYTMKYKDFQGTFCKIHNCYDVVIATELQKMKDKFRFNNKFYQFVILFVMFSACFSTLIWQLTRNKQKYELQKLYYEKSMEFNAESVAIYSLFYQYYQYYHIKHFSNQYLGIYSKYNITSLISEYNGKVDSNIKLIVQYLDNSEEINQPVNYTLQFKDFSSRADPKNQNFIDILYQAQIALKIDDPSFLIKNYDEVIKMIPSYNTLNNFNSAMLSQINQDIDSYIYLALAVFIFLLSSLSCTITLLTHPIISNIQNIYTHLDPETIQARSNQIQKCNQLLQKLRQFQNKSHIKQLVPSTSTISDDQSIKDGEFGPIESDHDLLIPKQNKQVKKNIKFKHLSVILMEEIYPIIIFTLKVIVFYVLYQFLVSSSVETAEVFQYIDSMQKTVEDITNKSSIYYLFGIYYHRKSNLNGTTLNKNIKQEQPPFHSEYELPLPKAFKQFISYKNKITSGNLCIYTKAHLSQLYKPITCEKVLDGILAKGLSEAYELYMITTNQVWTTPMDQFHTIKRNSSIYPLFMEISFLRRALYNIILVLQTEFIQYATSNNFKSYQQINSFIIIAIFAIFLLALLLWIFSWKLALKCQIAIKSFSLLPQSFLLKMDITRYLRKNKILKELQRL